MKEPNVVCDFCGKPFFKWPCYLKRTKLNFCCPQCSRDFSSRKKNPEKYHSFRDVTNVSKVCAKRDLENNPSRRPEVRKKQHESHSGRGEGKNYTLYFGQREHRVVAEQILGRPLRPGEVVHHIDGNKRNNDPSNLYVFSSSAEHSRYHAYLRWHGVASLESMANT